MRERSYPSWVPEVSHTLYHCHWERQGVRDCWSFCVQLEVEVIALPHRRYSIFKYCLLHCFPRIPLALESHYSYISLLYSIFITIILTYLWASSSSSNGGSNAQERQLVHCLGEFLATFRSANKRSNLRNWKLVAHCRHLPSLTRLHPRLCCRN